MGGPGHNKVYKSLPGLVLTKSIIFQITFGQVGQIRQVALNIPLTLHLLALLFRQRLIAKRCV
jgi:hypothetical protein